MCLRDHISNTVICPGLSTTVKVIDKLEQVQWRAIKVLRVLGHIAEKDVAQKSLYFNNPKRRRQRDISCAQPCRWLKRGHVQTLLEMNSIKKMSNRYMVNPDKFQVNCTMNVNKQVSPQSSCGVLPLRNSELKKAMPWATWPYVKIVMLFVANRTRGSPKIHSG